MRNRILICLLLLCVSVVFSGHGEAAEKEKVVIRMAIDQLSGQVFDAIAKDRGFYEEEGIETEMIFSGTVQEAFAALSSGKVDILSTYGTNRPLQYIGQGEDLTIFAGYMLNGAMPIVAVKGTVWNGVKDLIGKKVAANTTYYAICGPLYDMGYSPEDDINWIDFDSHTDRLAAVRAGEADYAIVGTGNALTIEAMGLEEVSYNSEVLPDYSCCRVVSNTSWLKSNPEAAKSLLKAWLRAQVVYENERDYAIALTSKQLDISEEQIASYMKDPHFEPNLDPYKSAVKRAWDYMNKLGLMGEIPEGTNLDDHINTTIYKSALDECVKDHYDENPAFYDRQLKIYAENNK